MSGLVFVAVIGAALLHAAWNALVKGGADKTLSMGAVVIGHLPIALVALPFVPLPAAESLPYLAGGLVLHFGYQLFLLQSYKMGDLTQVYPIARGSAPLIVAVFSVLVLGVHLNGLELLAIAIIGLGIISLALVRQSDGQQNKNAAAFALTTGVFIASYSLVDGVGARIAGTSLGFYCWLSLGNGILMIAYLAARSPQTLRAIPRTGLPILVLGGGASFIAYAVVTWAFTQAPIALVTALRETSIVFALLIGVFFLKEPLNLVKVFSTFSALLGAILLRYARS
ncbi:DMT family transporter [Sulfitobacter mediterraneus]|jgi:drug/metabolite transporter (DMT)-like permease|uniref:EamA-like transporter family protein n=1 Tax=Sulfitobacter mediterraneus TaxID=83219 RepID=A0A2T6CCX2_9RHOB|nr:DMT family transporter [Sulfitobacter mediterraneus]KIN79673.1 putative transporter, permease protein [Sulfitobacter mediterraneus KCTC 32188]PTX73345.1 EamA-like transporter family protein [Sulfitobacter mediterraneus]UWR09583.1 DMT family transporter [Sulfitobacter mediterraneus]